MTKNIICFLTTECLNLATTIFALKTSKRAYHPLRIVSSFATRIGSLGPMKGQVVTSDLSKQNSDLS